MLEILIGKSWGQRIIIFGAIALYLYLSFYDPQAAKESATQGLRTFVSLLTLILAALMIASAIETVVPTDLIAGWLGEQAGARGVATAGIIGGLLPGGPYAVYPIIKGLYDGGASYAAVIAMLMGYGAIGIGRAAYGLVFFEPEIVGLRLLLAVPVPIIAGLIVYYLL